MTKDEFLKKISDINCTWLAPIDKEFEKQLAEYSDFEATPGSIKKGVKTPGKIKFIK